MSWPDLLLIGLAGIWAGFINTVVGSGTLITFPVLLGLGMPPVTANVSNSIGLAPGSLAGAWSSRSDLTGQRSRIIRYSVASSIGATIGALLLLRLPSSVFDAVVPILIAVGCVLVILGPAMTRRLRARRERLGHLEVPAIGPHWLFPAVLVSGIYGGYFGAAQGVILIGLLGMALNESLIRTNALKNLLIGLCNAIPGIIFAIVSEVDWTVVGVLALTSIIGGQAGVRVGRLLPPLIYRITIVLVGVIAIIAFIF